MALSEQEYERRAKVLRENGDMYDQYHLTKDLPDNLRTIPSNKANTPEDGKIGQAVQRTEME